MANIPKFDGTRRITGTALAVRTLSGHTKLLVPVSAAAATAKRHNQHKQILVVPTPGGGARLATVAGGTASLLRHPNRRDSSTIGINRGDGGYKTASDGSTYNGNHNTCNNTSRVDTAHLLRQQQLQQQQLREQYLRLKKEEEMIPEWKRKEDFFAALGLVTKQALKEIQNKKCERKRRTTANPQFSNAAIEAKRINAMEVAAKRAKRKELAAAAERNTAAPLTRIARRNNSMPIVPIQSSIRSSMRPLISTTLINSSSNNHKAVLRPCSSSTHLDKSRNLVERLKSRYQLHSSSPTPLTNTTSHHNNNKTVNLNKTVVTRSKILHNCYVCYETCDPQLDVIMSCKDCRCYFHATCVSSVDDINRNNWVPCPSCYKRLGCNSPDSIIVEPPIIQGIGKLDLEDMEEENEDLEGEDEDEVDNSTSRMDHNGEENGTINDKSIASKPNDNSISDDKKFLEATSSIITESKSKSNPQISVKYKESLLNRKIHLSKLITEGKKRQLELTATLHDLKEGKNRLLKERSKIEECLEKVTNVIKMVKESGDMGNKPTEQKANNTKATCDGKDKEPETNLTKITLPNESKTRTESDSSSSDDDSSDSGDDDDDDDDEDDDESNETGPSDEKKKERTARNEKHSPKNPDENKQSQANVEQVESKEKPKKTASENEKQGESESDKIDIIEGVAKIQVISGVEGIKTPQNTGTSLEGLTVDTEIKNEAGPLCEQSVEQFDNKRVSIVIDENWVNLGGDEVVIIADEEGNLRVVDEDAIPLDKCNEFEEDETSAAVASIQDQMDVDSL